MKKFTSLILGCALNLGTVSAEIDPERTANTIILTEQGAKNLRIELAEATERTFEKTLFAIGRVEVIPRNRSVLSSRIPGRVVTLNAFIGEEVKKGDTLARVESRQPGDPPPVIDLKSPRTGLILKSHITDGDAVEPNAELLDVVDLSSVWAIAKVPEAEAAKLKPGTKAHISIPALGDERIEGKFLRFGVQADRTTSSLDAIFIIANKENQIRPGMRAEFSIVTDKRENVLSIPRTAVQGGNLNRVVYVRDFELDHAYIKSPVVLGVRNDLYYEVKSGLFPGDEVVTRGSYALSFAGGGDGPSLKEALDAAHGHEHNDDGSEMSEADKAKKAANTEGHDHGAGGHSALNKPILIWACISTVLSLILIQANLRGKKTSPTLNS
jgi:multidrug efflux pump subunit AcrA (membrane-fusion protein)